MPGCQGNGTKGGVSGFACFVMLKPVAVDIPAAVVWPARCVLPAHRLQNLSAGWWQACGLLAGGHVARQGGWVGSVGHA